MVALMSQKLKLANQSLNSFFCLSRSNYQSVKIMKLIVLVFAPQLQLWNLDSLPPLRLHLHCPGPTHSHQVQLLHLQVFVLVLVLVLLLIEMSAEGWNGGVLGGGWRKRDHSYGLCVKKREPVRLGRVLELIKHSLDFNILLVQVQAPLELKDVLRFWIKLFPEEVVHLVDQLGQPALDSKSFFLEIGMFAARSGCCFLILVVFVEVFSGPCEDVGEIIVDLKSLHVHRCKYISIITHPLQLRFQILQHLQKHLLTTLLVAHCDVRLAYPLLAAHLASYSPQTLFLRQAVSRLQSLQLSTFTNVNGYYGEKKVLEYF